MQSEKPKHKLNLKRRGNARTKNAVEDFFVNSDGSIDVPSDAKLLERVSANENFSKYFDVDLEKMVAPKRIWELDAIRGFCILLMVWDHFMYMLAFLFGPAWFGRRLEGDSFLAHLCQFAKWYWSCTPREIIHPIVLFCFFAICGTATAFSRSNLKRGLQLMALAVGISIVTYSFYDGAMFIHYGTLHFLATCILFWTFFDRILSFNKTVQKIAVPLVSLAVCIIVAALYFAYADSELENLPTAFGWLFEQGSLYGSFNSPGEHMAFIPYAAFFFFGAAVGPVIYRKKKTLLPKLDRAWHKPFCFVGRHALFVYVVHQIIIVAILAILSVLWLDPGNWVIF